MRSIILASHGMLASGMRDSVEMIAGSQQTLEVLCAYTAEQPDARSWLECRVGQMTDGDELVIVTDLLGGSVNNEASEFRNRRGVYVVSGMSLGLVLALVLGDGPMQELIDEAVKSAKAQVMRIAPEGELEEEDF